jgi:hypothetical protein
MSSNPKFQLHTKEQQELLKTKSKSKSKTKTMSFPKPHASQTTTTKSAFLLFHLISPKP